MLSFQPNLALSLFTVTAVMLASLPAWADEGTATVKGKVTMNGKPVANGRIFIHCEKDQFVGAKIKDGNYSVDRVPVGNHRITVEADGIAEKYSDEEKTSLKMHVRLGDNIVDLSLKQ
jgi:hypothetical protein